MKLQKGRLFKLVVCMSMIFIIFTALPVSANGVETEDLSTWTEESYPAVSGFPAGSWTVSADNTTVYQSNNGQPTFFYSDFSAVNTQMQGTIKVTGGDDDYIGFALGFQPGDSTNTNADYLLIDWKRGTQYYNFGSPSCGLGSTAPAGLAVSRVQGIPTADEFWGHNDICSPSGQGLTELARGVTLNSTGWIIGQEYTFRFEFTQASLKVYVDNVLEIDITGTFNNGRLAFYNFSQAGVTYSGYTVIPLSIEIEKSTNGIDADTAPGPSIPVGDPVTWEYVVTNTGNATLTNVAVTDDKGVVVTCPQDTLAPGESMSCVATGTAVAGQYSNIGIVKANYGDDNLTATDPSHYFGTDSPVEPPVEVGGQIYQTNKTNLLIPLIAAAVIIISMSTILIWRRRTQS